MGRITPFIEGKQCSFAKELFIKCIAHSLGNIISYQNIMSALTCICVTSVMIIGQLSTSHLHFGLLCKFNLLLKVLLQPVIGVLDLLINVPHASINKQESNNRKEQKQVVVQECQQWPCDSKELRERHGVRPKGADNDIGIEKHDLSKLEDKRPYGV